MKYQASDFLTLRALILKNSIFNTLLTANLLDTRTPVIVGSSLIKLEGKLRRAVKEKKGEKAKLPKYIIADIVVTLGLSFDIGYSYQDYPPIFIRHITIPSGSRINALKKLASIIFETYSIHASKTDEIFSRQPKSLATLLEYNKISANCWKTGFSKKLKEVSVEDICETELDTYHKELKARLMDWRIFNSLLIGLNKEGRLEVNSPILGKLTVEKTVLDKRVCITFISRIENTHLSTIAHYSDLSPNCWDKLNSAIDIFTLRNFWAIG